ncbi:hypothetical protein VD0002_g5465 [Verticillium dahliae]|uniref:Uncharacterized protein n=1 Tax=Verticillium dahliae TaxID=27337 RepID=A0A444SBC8_VERDA|nr:hypothetical protein VD0004_g7585 [Verticillium dahliae]PNH62666.1 hypothetical protein VD0002_g5465 [Verticillium dahliae]PNH75659.1 hypothetical protein VD0001_g1935 [Verticillium dahliae]RXG50695.1 hypothetical protein VDGE_30661 [Verticillium dahliae]
MVSDSSSNIRVFIRWDDQTVFAGEEIKCTITFKNVAADPSQHKQTQRQANVADRPRYATPLHRGKPITGSTPPTPSTAGPSRGHRSTLSLSAPAAFSRSRSGSIGTEAREGACAGSQLAHYAPGWPRDLWTSVSITTAGQLSDVQIYTYVRSTPPVSRSINLAKYSRHRRPFPTVTVTF